MVNESFEETIKENNKKLTSKIARAGGGNTGKPDFLSGEGGENIKYMLNMKADKTDIESLLDTKCSKIDAETIKDI